MKLSFLKTYLEKENPGETGVTGGVEIKLHSILQKFYQTLSSDLMIGFFFAGKDLEKIIHGQTKLLMTVMGFEKKYDGVPVSQAHANIAPIGRGHFHRRIVLLEKVLIDLDLPEAAKQDWLNFEKQFENVVVS